MKIPKSAQKNTKASIRPAKTLRINTPNQICRRTTKEKISASLPPKEMLEVGTRVYRLMEARLRLEDYLSSEILIRKTLNLHQEDNFISKLYFHL